MAGADGETFESVNPATGEVLAATARKVLAAAAETLTPVLAECGGKDALLVAADADLDAAADAAAWGAMSNAGQTCVGVERVYVAEAVYHSFLDKLADVPADSAAEREETFGPVVSVTSVPSLVFRPRGRFVPA